MADTFRARNPVPPPFIPQQAPSQRFPHSKDNRLDADERRAAASKGFLPFRQANPPGGLKLAPAEWKLLIALVLVACAVRLFRITHPRSVV